MDLSLPGVIADRGGDSSAVRDQLKGVQQIQATGGAFAAILEDGSVVTWGDEDSGGDSSAVGDQLKRVQQIQATMGAFAAILADGSVVTWGDEDLGGDSSEVRDQLKDVHQIQATGRAFAAILEDGSVVSWGKEDAGGDSSAVGDQLKGVQQIQSTEKAFAEGRTKRRGRKRNPGSFSLVTRRVCRMATPELPHTEIILYSWSCASGWLVGEKGKLQDTAPSHAVFYWIIAHAHTHTHT